MPAIPDGFTVHDTSGGYYVCVECAHTWAAPYWPDRCENCSAPPATLSRFDDLDAAEDFSESILTREEN